MCSVANCSAKFRQALVMIFLYTYMFMYNIFLVFLYSISYTGFNEYMKTYLNRWRRHHKFWLRDYEGDVMFVLYQELVDDINGFIPMVKYFGYEYNSTRER